MGAGRCGNIVQPANKHNNKTIKIGPRQHVSFAQNTTSLKTVHCVYPATVYFLYFSQLVPHSTILAWILPKNNLEILMPQHVQETVSHGL